MAFVPLINSNAQLIITDSAGTARNMTAFWVGGHPEVSQEAVEVTSIADVAKRNIIGLTDAALTFNFLFDSSGTAAPYHVFYNLKAAAATAATTLLYYPDGTASGKPKITILPRLTSINFGGGVGEKVTLDVSFANDGTVTLGTA